MIDTELKIWAAGAFDGEGSALINVTSTPGQSKSNSFHITVAVVNTDKKLIEPFQECWGGKLTTKSANRPVKDSSPRKEAYQLDFDRDEALILLQDIIPFLRVRKQAAVLVCRALLDRQPGKDRAPRGSTSLLESYYLDGVEKGFWSLSKNYQKSLL